MVLKDNEVVIFKCELEALKEAAQEFYDLSSAHDLGWHKTEVFTKLKDWGFISTEEGTL